MSGDVEFPSVSLRAASVCVAGGVAEALLDAEPLEGMSSGAASALAGGVREC